MTEQYKVLGSERFRDIMNSNLGRGGQKREKPVIFKSTNSSSYL